MKKFSFILFFIFINTYSQNKLQGAVFDAFTNEKLKYVTIAIKDQNKGTFSDENGNFEIEVNHNDILIFKSIGYKNIELTNFESETLNVSMQKDTVLLNEVSIKPVIKKCKKYKIKYNKCNFYSDNCKFNEILFEGTIIKRRLQIDSKYLCSIDFELHPNYDAKIILRPYITDVDNNSLLVNDYTAVKTLKKGKINKIEFDFKENIFIKNEDIYLGLEIISLPNNNNYTNNVQIICSGDKTLTTEVVSAYENFVQQNGLIMNFNKKYENSNIKVNLTTSK